MVKLDVLKKSYVNVSGELYDSEFVNLVHIADEKIDFDDRTLFLEKDMKEKLNQEAITSHSSGVYIINNRGKMGVICELPIEEYQRGVVRNHELVLPETIQGMLNNYRGYNAEAAPVMLITKNRIELDQFVINNKSDEEYSVKDVKLYYYSGKTAHQLLEQVGNTDMLYVGDGHHRLYSTSLSGFKKSVLSYVIGIDDINIMPIHRQLPHLSEESFNTALQFLEKKFQVEELDVADGTEYLPNKDDVIMYRNKRAWRIHLIHLMSDGFWNNDIYRLNTQVIQQAFRTFDTRKVRYLSQKAFQSAKRRSTRSVFFQVAPMTKQEFVDSASQGNILPPKSTWMTPKAPSLLVINRYQE